MTTYEKIRQSYKPGHVRVLLIAESPPPPANIQSSRQFYYHDRIRTADRLFVNTIKALYEEADKLTEAQIEANKEAWLKRFQADGFYMIEALDESQPHEATKQERQEKIRAHLPVLLEKVRALAEADTKIILIKSNVFDVAARPLRDAGFQVLNTELVDYPGQFNQRAYREKLRRLLHDALY
jgi:tRNA(Leu) C34 or U34 (ribose-2'-O)-methylase TrmL